LVVGQSLFLGHMINLLSAMAHNPCNNVFCSWCQYTRKRRSSAFISLITQKPSSSLITNLEVYPLN
jgi:hypothetical protein